ncbi:MAG: CvpA family protein [Eubacteriales bacterium]|nr:CvpA family protein [Eubacteriales bacterium]
MNYIDYFILGVIGISVLYGIYRGFVQTVLSLGSALFSVFGSIMIFPKLADWLAKQGVVREALGYVFHSSLLKNVSAATQSMQDIALGSIESIMDGLRLPSGFSGTMRASITQAIQSRSGEALGDFVSRGIAHLALQILCFIVCYFALYFAISLVLNIVRGIFKFPALKYMDWLAGALMGFMRGVLFVVVIFTLLPLVQTVLPMPELNLWLQQSQFASFFQGDALLLQIFKRNIF